MNKTKPSNPKLNKKNPHRKGLIAAWVVGSKGDMQEIDVKTGHIKEIRTFDSALSDKEVFELYKKSVCKPYSLLGETKKKVFVIK